MKNLYLPEIDRWRIRSGPLIDHMGTAGNQTCGAFMVNGSLAVIASCGEGWDHVSVSRRDRCPNWQEMEFIKRLFFYDEECAMQLHVPVSQHINVHPHCLHLWRPWGVPIPQPPSWMVG